ncbi:MAG: aminopeptidase [Clostridia bacterium]|nr:aminopeptidase [Clostridia bacterium]
MTQDRLDKYATLLVTCGLNVHPGQEVMIQCGLDQPDFVTLVVRKCYEAGASRVTVKWDHMPISRLGYEYRSLETLSEVLPQEIEEWKRRAEKHVCYLWLDSDDPDGLSGTDSEKIAKANMARYPFLKPYKDALENNYQWCIAAVPGKAWAKKIFPALTDDAAVEKLWEYILMCSRVDDDPVEAWRLHNNEMDQRCKVLNAYRFDRMEYHSSNGTDFTVWLNPRGLFSSGGEYTLDSHIYFNPNIPSEEVFTSPLSGRAEGKVVATKPLSYQGKLIEDFWFMFRDGKVTEVHARTNQDALEKMVQMDEGASRLGEIALIAMDSPVNLTGVLFYNTLFDENASCHIAFGRGFNECLEGYESMSVEECEKAGVNNSMIHTDFMIGAPDLNITGVTKDGRRIHVFINGRWAF